MQELVDLSNLNLSQLTAVHIAGTNGKGSVCAMVERVARTKKKTGLFTSPHLIDLNERIRINGKKITNLELNELLEWVKPLQEKTSASFFEVITLIAFKHFIDCKVELAVIETGLGGRLDATNVLPNTLPIITNVSLDHTEKLGDTIKKIASEKSAIIKGDKAVLACKGEALEECLLKTRNSIIVGEPQNIGVSWTGTKFKYNNREWHTNLIGEHQALNATTAIEACRTLGFTDEEIAVGIEKVNWPGRFEVRDKIVLDGAHNPVAVRALAGTIRALDWKPVIVLAVMADKNVEGIVDALQPVSKTIICTQINKERCLPAIDLLGLVGEGIVVEDCVEAVREAKKLGEVLVTGSLFLVGEIRELL